MCIFVDDKTRVVMETNDGKTDYINANHVKVSGRFILNYNLLRVRALSKTITFCSLIYYYYTFIFT